MEKNYDDLNISVSDYLELRKKTPSLQLIDVRQPDEYEESSIKEATLIPLDIFDQELDQLNKEGCIVIHCRSGKRSMAALRYLKERGYNEVYNLEGGILAWDAYFKDQRSPS